MKSKVRSCARVPWGGGSRMLSRHRMLETIQGIQAIMRLGPTTLDLLWVLLSLECNAAYDAAFGTLKRSMAVNVSRLGETTVHVLAAMQETRDLRRFVNSLAVIPE